MENVKMCDLRKGLICRGNTPCNLCEGLSYADKEKEILYHLSLDIDNIVDEFAPRIPSEDNRLDSEDNVTPRISVSKTVKGCLSAAPWGGSVLTDTLYKGDSKEIRKYNFEKGLRWTEFNDEEMDEPILIRVYEFDKSEIVNGNLVDSEYLYQTDKVRDAELTEEVWVINQSLKPIRTYLIKLTHYNDNYCGDDIPYWNKKMCEEDESEDIEDYIEGSFCLIEEVEYEEIFELYYEYGYIDETLLKIAQMDNEKLEKVMKIMEIL